MHAYKFHANYVYHTNRTKMSTELYLSVQLVANKHGKKQLILRIKNIIYPINLFFFYQSFKEHFIRINTMLQVATGKFSRS